MRSNCRYISDLTAENTVRTEALSELLHHLIDRTAERYPEREAIRFGKETLTYAKLAQRSNALANTLVEKNVKPGDRVGIYKNKSSESAVAMYGIMKAGAVYVPLDPSAPTDRIEMVVRDCGIRCLISDDRRLADLEQIANDKLLQFVIGLSSEVSLAGEFLSWDDVWSRPHNSAPDADITTHDPSYIIYTSGSTGTPKGIMHTHHSGWSFADWAARTYRLSGDDRLTNHAPLHFDLSIFDFFAGAVAGATTVIIPEPVTKFPASYSQLLQDERISVFFTVPFALIQLDSHGVLEDRDLHALRWIIFGGEPFQPKFLRSLMNKLPDAAFDNMYGPAEVNGCTHYTVSRNVALSDDPIPIGTVNEGMEGIVVDDRSQEVPAGQEGELLIRTPTMMQGYWARPDLNEQAFFVREKARYYRTGDLVQEQSDGNLQFIGRKDRQIKVRGYRVELDEIESAIASHPAVEEAGAFSVPDGMGSNRIEAAVTVKGLVSSSSEELLAHAKSQLAWYAVPARIALEESLPRTSTGKIDRRRLQEIASGTSATA